MDGKLSVSAGQLRSFAMYMHDQVAADLQSISVQASEEGCNKSGFTGLLTPLQAAMDALSSIVSDVHLEALSHIYNVAEALSVTADNYEHIDHATEKNLYEIGNGRLRPIE